MMEEAGKGVAVALQENLRALAAEEAHRFKAMINLISNFLYPLVKMPVLSKRGEQN